MYNYYVCLCNSPVDSFNVLQFSKIFPKVHINVSLKRNSNFFENFWKFWSTFFDKLSSNIKCTHLKSSCFTLFWFLPKKGLPLIFRFFFGKKINQCEMSKFDMKPDCLRIRPVPYCVILLQYFT